LEKFPEKKAEKEIKTILMSKQKIRTEARKKKRQVLDG
jgi:hypothetical protein